MTHDFQASPADVTKRRQNTLSALDVRLARIRSLSKMAGHRREFVGRLRHCNAGGRLAALEPQQAENIMAHVQVRSEVANFVKWKKIDATRAWAGQTV